ncbi:MAG: hypothetical protein HQK79_20875 [Desulfobacterales bacterium]|nr:hypothetical protein [Desulfobacterales bacterium]MBF0397441.1 hypothetical protein [Desulfobacterales bacterium]
MNLKQIKYIAILIFFLMGFGCNKEESKEESASKNVSKYSITEPAKESSIEPVLDGSISKNVTITKDNIIIKTPPVSVKQFAILFPSEGYPIAGGFLQIVQEEEKEKKFSGKIRLFSNNIISEIQGEALSSGEVKLITSNIFMEESRLEIKANFKDKGRLEGLYFIGNKEKGRVLGICYPDEEKEHPYDGIYQIKFNRKGKDLGIDKLVISKSEIASLLSKVTLEETFQADGAVNNAGDILLWGEGSRKSSIVIKAVISKENQIIGNYYIIGAYKIEGGIKGVREGNPQ